MEGYPISKWMTWPWQLACDKTAKKNGSNGMAFAFRDGLRSHLPPPHFDFDLILSSLHLVWTSSYFNSIAFEWMESKISFALGLSSWKSVHQSFIPPLKGESPNSPWEHQVNVIILNTHSHPLMHHEFSLISFPTQWFLIMFVSPMFVSTILSFEYKEMNSYHDYHLMVVMIKIY